MSKENKETIDPGTPEGKEMLLQYVEAIQKVDKQTAELKGHRKDILNRAKQVGFNKTLINKTINEIRKQQKKTKVQDAEEETYYTVIKEAGLVEPV